MGAYIVRRLLLIIPTLFLILLTNFIIVQAAPGGPVEQAIHQAESGTAQGGIGAGTGDGAAAASRGDR